MGIPLLATVTVTVTVSMIYMYVRFSTFGHSRVIPYASIFFKVFTLDIEKKINTYFELIINILLYFTSLFHLLLL